MSQGLGKSLRVLGLIFFLVSPFALHFSLLNRGSATTMALLRGGLILSAGAPHAVVNLGLLAIFGLSLLPGREPIVTYFARAIHGGVSPEVELYTRRVTWVWCGFFGLQLAGSVLLLAFAPIAWWSIFVSILNLPLVAAMMLGEWLTRPLWVPDPPREYLRDMLRMPKLLGQRLRKPGAQAL